MEGLIGFVVGIAGLSIAVWVAYSLYISIPADMARERRRDPTAWVLVAIFGSPFLAIFLLWALGDAE